MNPNLNDLHELINMLRDLWDLYRCVSALFRIFNLLKRFIEWLRKGRRRGDDQKPRFPQG